MGQSPQSDYPTRCVSILGESRLWRSQRARYASPARSPASTASTHAMRACMALRFSCSITCEHSKYTCNVCMHAWVHGCMPITCPHSMYIHHTHCACDRTRAYACACACASPRAARADGCACERMGQVMPVYACTYHTMPYHGLT